MPSSFRTFNHTNSTTHNCHSHTIHFTTSISESKLTIIFSFKTVTKWRARQNQDDWLLKDARERERERERERPKLWEAAQVTERPRPSLSLSASLAVMDRFFAHSAAFLSLLTSQAVHSSGLRQVGMLAMLQDLTSLPASQLDTRNSGAELQLKRNKSRYKFSGRQDKF